MKKILTASLVAMMAVTAANAEIASTTYVDDRTGDVANSTYVKSLAEGSRNLASAVDALAANMGDGGSVETQIDSKIETFENDVIGDLGDSTNVADAIADAKQEAISTAGSNADTKISTAKAAMKLNATGGTGNFIQQVSQADGTVAATATAFVTTVDATTKDSVIAPTTKAIKSYVDTQVGGATTNLTALQNTVTEQGAAIGNLTSTVSTNKTAAETALNNYKTEAANIFMDSDEVDAAITAAVTNTQTGALKNYSTTEQMNTAITNANNTQTTAITNAYTAADTALETSLKKYSDDKDTAQTTTITNAYTAADTALETSLKGYADQAEADAIDTAEDFTLAEIAKIVNAADMTDGTKVLTLKVSGNTKTLGWETIGR